MQHPNLAPVPVRRPRGFLRLGRRQFGVTLIEWLVSIVIGLILLAGLAALIAQQSRTQAELDKSSRQIENGRYAMQLLQDDIQLAGYYGEFSNVSGLTLPATLPNPCSVVTADLTQALPFPIQGYDAPSVLPSNLSDPVAAGGCGLNAANYLAGTDILVIRRADTEVMGATLTPGQVYFQSGLTPSTLIFNFVLAAASSTAVDTGVFNLTKKDGTVAPLRKYLVHIYFVSPCSVPANGSTCSNTNTDDGGISVPTLKRLELSLAAGATKFALVPLVEGIENMQIDYGFDVAATDPLADGAVDSFLKDAPGGAVTRWADVMAVRVNLLARNNERSGGYVDTKTYNLGLAGTTAATNDGFKRKVFSQLIRVVNPSSRREK